MHMVIDLETLSLKNRAVVTQLGFAIFDPRDSFVNMSSVFYLDPMLQSKIGRVMDWPTIAWWMGQNDEARQKMIAADYQEPIKALEEFCQFFEIHQIECVWGHGATFDITILQDLMEHLGIVVPWDHRNIRDTRTLFALRPDDKLPKAEIPHSAEHDAIVEALHIQKVTHSLLNDTGI